LANAKSASASFTAPTNAPAPIVDPDLLINGDFKRLDQSPFTDLYQGRENQIQQWLSALQAQPQTGAGLDQMLTSALGAGHQFAYLKSLDTQRHSGQDITPQLEAIRLTEAGLDYVLRVGTLLNGGQNLLDSEWTNLYSILIQVQKHQSFPSWRALEFRGQISLTPDDFNYPPRSSQPLRHGSRRKWHAHCGRGAGSSLDNHCHTQWSRKFSDSRICNHHYTQRIPDRQGLDA
jgi:hypothetical protein